VPFLVQAGHEQFYLPELIRNGDLEGVVLQIAHGAPWNLGDLSSRQGVILVDPQTYRLADANVRLTKRMAAQPFVALWPGAAGFRDVARRVHFVERTLQSQLEMGATDLISPYLFVEDTSGPALEHTLEMAEDCRQIVGTSRRVWAGVYVAGSELKRPQRRDQLLNLVTSSSIDHCYLIVDPEQAGSGPISDEDLIRALRHVVRALEANGIRVMLGYSDPVGLLLMADGLSAFASGVRASLRRLRMAAQRRGGGGGRPPHMRYYVPQLMNFVRVDTELRPTVARLTVGGASLCQCRYCQTNLPGLSSGQFDGANALRHFVARLTDDARAISSMGLAQRLPQVRRLIQDAGAAYEGLAKAGIALAGDSGADHVRAWQKVF
jgi:hypothetical protein